jgi:broad specificity phosphatase PhoE
MLTRLEHISYRGKEQEPDAITVWLIRHQESESNAQKSYKSVSPKEIPLTERGKKNAEVFSNTFPFEPSVIITSDFLRAQESAEPLTERFPDTEIIRSPLFREFTYLALNEKSSREERLPLVSTFWESRLPDLRHNHTAESFSMLLQRAWLARDYLKSLPYPNAALFTHEQVIRALQMVNEFGTNPATWTDGRKADLMRAFRKQSPIHNGGIVQFVLKR